MDGRGANGRSRLAGWRIIAASCVARGFQQKTMEEIGRQNLKYYSPRSESDRGGLVLKIKLCCGQTKNRHHQPAPHWRQDKKYISQHGQPDHGKAPKLVNAPTSSPSPGPSAAPAHGARSARPAETPTAPNQLCAQSTTCFCGRASSSDRRPGRRDLLLSECNIKKCVVATFVLSEDTCCFEYAEKQLRHAV